MNAPLSRSAALRFTALRSFAALSLLAALAPFGCTAASGPEADLEDNGESGAGVAAGAEDRMTFFMRCDGRKWSRGADVNGSALGWDTPWSGGDDAAAGLPGYGTVQAANNFMAGGALHQSIWRGERHHYRTVKYDPVTGRPDWNSASGWTDLNVGLPGQGSVQAYSGYVLGNTLYEGLWRGNEGWIRHIPVVDGQPRWDQPTKGWSGPISSAGLPGGGDMQSQNDYILGGTLRQGFWRGNQGFWRDVPISGDTVLWGNATPWSAPIALSAMPCQAAMETTSSYFDYAPEAPPVDSDPGPGSGSVDMADYVIPGCGSAGDATQIGSEQFRVVPAGMHGGRGRFAIVKSSDGKGFEEWWVDSQYLRIRSDTTWAYEASPGLWCDVKCGDNHGGNCQQRWNTDPSSPHNGLSPSSPWAYTVYHEPGNPDLAAPWIPRQLDLPVGGQTQYTTFMEIKAADRNSCSGCWVNFTTAPGASVGRTVTARRYASWNGYSDVVHLNIQGGPGAGEQYYYAKGKGWIGFNDKVASGTVGSSAFPQSSCANFQAGSICDATGGAVQPPSNPGGGGTQPPSNPSGCPCRTDVDNYCLYPKSEAGCGMLKPGGYCDPDGNGGFEDGDWNRGYNEYHASCK